MRRRRRFASARGVAPVAGRKYEVKFVFDYAEKVYSVAIDGKTRFRSLKGTQTAAGFLSPSGQIGVCDPVVSVQTAGLASSSLNFTQNLTEGAKK